MNGKRNEHIDLVKGIAILFVVVGHCIQFGSGADYLSTGEFFENPVFKFIYSFHMPLFMLISGYLFFFSAQRKTFVVIKNKVMGILLPLVTWHTVVQLISLTFGGKFSPTVFFLSYFQTLWFLRALFFCCMITLFINRVCKDESFGFIITTILLFFIPQRIIPDVFVFTTPFFFAGYLANKYQVISSFLQSPTKHQKGILMFCSLAFFIMLWNYEKDYYVYVSGTCLFSQYHPIGYMLFVNIYRIVTATMGCPFILWATTWLHQLTKSCFMKGLIIKLSQSSLCIYIVNHYLNDTLLISLPIHQVNYLFVTIETVGVILISYACYWLLKQNKVSSQMFLGGR